MGYTSRKTREEILNSRQYRLKRLRAQLPATLDELRATPWYSGDETALKRLKRDLASVHATCVGGVWQVQPTPSDLVIEDLRSERRVKPTDALMVAYIAALQAAVTLRGQIEAQKKPGRS